ncbi:MAG: AraC family transcriptional regulator [Bacteroides sp.]|nr:AraC family transcriptional regulator [Eubacterium sp.]MCM1419264.1 AraC family transcriptional regulator [Roseburia sp.]MCM1461387.1 AraC family transcriptional regulator [Bacteroides sp.]
MFYLYEESDSLENPIECFVFDASRETFPVRPHWHYFAEILYMLEGAAEVRVEEERYVIGEGELFLIHPSVVHSIWSADGGAPKYAAIKFDIGRLGLTPAYAPKLRSIFRYARREGGKLRFSPAEARDMDCGRILLSCISEVNGRRYGCDLVLQAQLYSLLMGIVRCWIADGLTIDSRRVPAEDSLGVENVTEYIDRSLGEELRVEKIAAVCGMSYSGFAKKFRELYGMSCKEYIERMRIYKAEEFLIFTDFDLNYISQETGFSDCSHLIKSFKKYRGTTPKQYRLKRGGG